MLDHHIQRQIVYQLAFADSRRFGELKPDEIENKLFTYHLKKVIAAKLVQKLEDGSYTLTAEGRRVGKGALTTRERTYIDRAYSIILIALKRDKEWLLFRRSTHPQIDRYGFLQARPIADRPILDVARDTLLADTNLTADLSVHGHGYFRVYRDAQLESFIHFTLLRGTNIHGDVCQNNELGTFEWVRSPDFSSPEMLPNMQTLHKMCEGPAGSFVDEKFEV